MIASILHAAACETKTLAAFGEILDIIKNNTVLVLCDNEKQLRNSRMWLGTGTLVK